MDNEKQPPEYIPPQAPPPEKQTMFHSEPSTDGTAVAAFIFGLLGFLVITVPVAVILGIISLSRISKSNGRLKGKEFAVLGIILPLFAGPVVGCLAAVAIPNMIAARRKAQLRICEGNCRNLGISTEMYMTEHEDEFPPDLKALEEEGYIGSIPVCPVNEREYKFTIVQSTDSQIFEISCPNPEEHYHAPNEKLSQIKYIQYEGLVEFDESGEPVNW